MPATREVNCNTQTWELTIPFRITGYTFTEAQLLEVTIRENGAAGRGEATGIYYLDETAASMLEQVEGIRAELERGADREALRELLPAGGARNAIDCALWDLEAKRADRSIWALTGIMPGRTETVQTVGIGDPDEMAAKAKVLDTRTLKLKLDDQLAVERVEAVRAARPDAEIIVDVNQGWTYDQLVDVAPRFAKLGVAMIEQPLPRGADEALEGYEPPVTLCADESCLHTGEFEQAARRYQMINIKLDKTGGLTEALELARQARSRDIALMVGNMVGTSLAMAPGYVIAQLCRFVDLDGALFLKRDRDHPMRYAGGVISPPSRELWG